MTTLNSFSAWRALLGVCLLLLLAGPMAWAAYTAQAGAWSVGIGAGLIIFIAWWAGALHSWIRVLGLALILDAVLALFLVVVHDRHWEGWVPEIGILLFCLGTAIGLQVDVEHPRATAPAPQHEEGVKTVYVHIRIIPTAFAAYRFLLAAIVLGGLTLVLPKAGLRGGIESILIRVSAVSIGLAAGLAVGLLLAWVVVKGHLKRFIDDVQGPLGRISRDVVGYTLGYLLVILVFSGFFAALYYSDKTKAFNRLNTYGVLEPLDQNTTFWDFLFFSMNTIAPLGYSEIRPITAVPRILAFVELTLGLGWTVVVFGALMKHFDDPTDPERAADNAAGTQRAPPGGTPS